MTTRRLFIAVALLALAGPLGAEAQKAGTVWRVGYLTVQPLPATAELRETFVEALRASGWAIGRNLVLEARSAEGQHERLASIAGDLVRAKVDVIVAVGNVEVSAAKQATSTVPIVMAIGVQPVRQGFITSLDRPGANITGTTWDLSAEVVGKEFELLKDLIPTASRAGFLVDPRLPGLPPSLKAAEDAAKSLGLALYAIEVRTLDDVEQALDTLARQRVEGIHVAGSPFLYANARQIAEMATRRRLPTTFVFRHGAASGGVLSYGPNLPEFFKKAASYVDKILKGAKPGDLPVEQATKYELVINLKTAKTLGLTIPPALLLQADEVIQ